MECAEIRPRLSEYMDGVLDAQTMSLVEKHMLTCRECKKTLESFQSLVQELSDLHPIKPPDDFLEQLHERMAKRFDLKNLMRRLFFPFRIKIPLQFATAAAMAVLIFFIIRTPEIEKEMADIPELEDRYESVDKTDTKDVFEASRGKGALAPAPKVSSPMEPHPAQQLAGSPKETAPVKLASKSKKTAVKPRVQGKEYPQEPSAVKAEPKPSDKVATKAIEIVLLLTSEVSMGADTPQLNREMTDFAAPEKGKIRERRASRIGVTAPAAPSHALKGDGLEEDQGIEYLAEGEIESKDESVSRVLSHDRAPSRVRDLIHSLKGTVLSMEYDQNTGQPRSLDAKIPAGQYGFFFEKLQQLGTLQSPPPALDAKGPEPIKIRIHFIHS